MKLHRAQHFAFKQRRRDRFDAGQCAAIARSVGKFGSHVLTGLKRSNPATMRRVDRAGSTARTWRGVERRAGLLRSSLAGAFSTDWLETRSGTAMNAAPLRGVERITQYGSWNRQSIGTFDLKPFKNA